MGSEAGSRKILVRLPRECNRRSQTERNERTSREVGRTNRSWARDPSPWQASRHCPLLTTSLDPNTRARASFEAPEKLSPIAELVLDEKSRPTLDIKIQPSRLQAEFKQSARDRRRVLPKALPEEEVGGLVGFVSLGEHVERRDPRRGVVLLA